jgi:hypothetical protein
MSMDRSHLPLLAMCALALSTIALAACGSSTASPTPDPRNTPVPSPTRYDSPTPVFTSVPPAATQPPATPGASGIEGQVLLGPTCPVERIDSPCPPRPGANLAMQFYAGGDTTTYVANVTTDGEGRFHIDLPPGNYTIEGPCSGTMKCAFAYPRLDSTTVTVHGGEFALVTVHGDTGIR